MRHRTVLSLALILGLVAALSTTPLLAKQDEGIEQDLKYNFSEGLEITPLGEEPGVDDPPFRAYSVKFAYGAFIPERTYDNANPDQADAAMVVKVQAGTFAFRVQSDGVIVDPQGNELKFVNVTPGIPFGSSPNDATPTPSYTLDGAAPGCIAGGVPDQGLCLLDPDAFTDEQTYVQLEQGYTVYLPDGSTCFFCNTTELGDETAELLVWSAAASEFSWYQLYLEGLAYASATPTAQGSGRILGWMLDPGSNCN